MSRLSNQEVKLYNDFFTQVDENYGSGSGKLSLENCEKALALCGFRLTKAAVKEFISAESDSEWEINREDFLAAINKVAPEKSSQHKAAELRRLFQAQDLNKDGHLSFHELRTQFSQSVSEEELRQFIKDWDKDGDWQLSFEEFVNMYTADSPGQPHDTGEREDCGNITE